MVDVVTTDHSYHTPEARTSEQNLDQEVMFSKQSVHGVVNGVAKKACHEISQPLSAPKVF